MASCRHGRLILPTHVFFMNALSPMARKMPSLTGSTAVHWQVIPHLRPRPPFTAVTSLTELLQWYYKCLFLRVMQLVPTVMFVFPYQLTLHRTVIFAPLK